MKILKYTAALLLILVLSSCNGRKTTDAVVDKSKEAVSKVTDEVQSLFDGQSLKGWHAYRHDTETSGWKVVDGTIMHDKSVDVAADLVSDEEYEDFELELEWNVQKCGNSGIFWNVVESDEYDQVWLTGPEMQVLDNQCHPDAKIVKHRAGDLYDLITVSEETVKPAGQWNKVKITSKDGKYAFWLNGVNVVNFEMHTPEWEEMVANSKFNTMPGFGKAHKGHIALQDHSDDVWYRNIQIKRL